MSGIQNKNAKYDVLFQQFLIFWPGKINEKKETTYRLKKQRTDVRRISQIYLCPWSQEYMWVLLWVSLWFIRPDCWENDLSHLSHLYGFSPVCVLSWIWVVNILNSPQDIKIWKLYWHTIYILIIFYKCFIKIVFN